VHYEDFVADPERGARSLLAFCGLEWHDACLRFHDSTRAARTLSMEQVREPVHTRAVGRWREFVGELEPFERARLAYLSRARP
jgi:hypothetical protein